MSNEASVKNSVLVYSTDPKDQALLSLDADKHKAMLQSKLQKSLIDTKKFTAVFRIETQGRGGKTVTVIDKFPAHEAFLKELTKELKNKCGAGGSCRIENLSGLIEIQGDKRDAIKKIFDDKKIKYKGM